MRSWPAPALPSSWTNTGAPPFVARREELRALHEAYSAAEGGAGRAIFISGDPGTGKSRLLATIGSAFHSLGAAVLYGDGIQEVGRALEPFDPALAPMLAALEASGDDRIPTEPLTVVRATFAAREDEAPPAIGQDRLFHSVLDVLTSASADRPIVLVLDDMHWAAEDAVRLLRRLVVGIADSHILVLTALRPDPPDRSEPLTEVIARLSYLPGVERMPLAPFTAADLAEYLRVGGLPADEADAAALALVEVTGGNPYLVRTTWHQVVEAISARDRRVDMPESVFEPLRPRLSMLSDTELPVLRVAAVLGHEVDLVELLAMSDTTQGDTLAAIDASVHAGLLEAPIRVGDPYRFPHAIARQAVLDGVPASELMRIHARIAQTLETQFPAAPRLVQRLAFHYMSARPLGFGERAVEYLIRSAESSDLQLAHEQAGGLFERAADLASDEQQRDALRRRSARSWALASDFARARDQYELGMESSDPRTRLRAAIGYEDTSWRQGLNGSRGVELLSAALDAVPADEGDPLVVEGLASLGRAIAFTGNPTEGARLGDHAIALARPLGDDRTLAATLRARIWQSLRPEGIRDRIAQADELEPLTVGMSEDWAGLTGVVASFGSYVLGDAAGMEIGQRRLTAASQRWGAYWTFWSECARFGRAFADGRLTDTGLILAEIGTIERGFRSDLTAGAYAVQGFMLRREAGRLGVAASVITGNESPSEMWAPGLLAIYTELGMMDASRRTLHWLLDRDNAHLHISADWPGRLAFMAEATLAIGDIDAGKVLLPYLREYSGYNLVSGFFIAQFGPADLYLAQLEAMCGTGDPRENFDRAIRLGEQLEAPLHIAYACAGAAAFERRNGDQAQARALADRARAIAEPLGLVRVLRGLPEASAAPSIGGLTPRETEVLRLLADGLSNREIATELVISEHTAANHVRSILTKVGVPNRTRAARFAREQGLA